MSATDELRRMLDERGVKWWAEDDPEEPAYYFVTKWFANGCEQAYEEIPAIRSRSLNAYCVTPEQAVEATLGRGECHDAAGKQMAFFSCSACGATIERKHPRFCFACGRKVVDE